MSKEAAGIEQSLAIFGERMKRINRARAGGRVIMLRNTHTCPNLFLHYSYVHALNILGPFEQYFYLHTEQTVSIQNTDRIKLDNSKPKNNSLRFSNWSFQSHFQCSGKINSTIHST